MSSYIIAGSSDKVDTSECENMSNLIKSYYPDISFKIVLKDQTQWEQYADEICRIYGFKQKCNPIIYTLDGRLIGDRNAFIQLAESKFGIIDPKLRQGPITPDVNKKIAKHELDQKLKLQNNKLNLTEKLEYQMLLKYISLTIKPTESIFQQSFRSGMKVFFYHTFISKIIQFLIKFESRLRPVKPIQKIHEKAESINMVIEENDVQAEIKIDGKKAVQTIPMFADKFITIEQQQLILQQQQEALQKEKDNQSNRQPSVVDTKNDIPDINQVISPRNKDAPVIPIIPETPQENEDAQSPDQQVNLENQAQSIYDEGQQEILEPVEEIKEDGVVRPSQINIQNYIIHQFKNQYVLFLHPQPLIDGQMILCKPEDNIILDYSMMKRGRINSYKKSSLNSSHIEGLYDYSLDLYKCFTMRDIEMVVKIIQKTDSIAALNILPQDVESFLALSNGHYNFILRQHADLNRTNKKLFNYLVEEKKQVNQKLLMPLEEYLMDKRSQCYEVGKDIYKLRSLDVSHLLAFQGNIYTPDSVYDIILKMISFQLDKDNSAGLKMGFHLIVSKYIIFMCPTYQNYDIIDDIKVHLSVFTVLGFLNLPEGSQQVDFFELLRKAQQK